MNGPTDVQTVLSEYRREFQPRRVEQLGSAGGFSGARFWRLTTDGGLLCLRRWPRDHPNKERLTYIHAVLQHVARQGFRAATLPLETIDGASFVELGGFFWELTHWMEGEADFHRTPAPVKLVAAMSTLAHFHTAAASFPTADPQTARSPGLSQRLARLRSLLGGGFAQIDAAVRAGDWPELEHRARRLLDLTASSAPLVLPQLEAASQHVLPLQPCIRDVWHDHLLFRGDCVSGIVDFGAMRHESVAGDLARLLGSLVHDDPAPWCSGLESYQSSRPLTAAERAAVDVFDRSSVLLSGMNWLDWIYVEGRRFDDRSRVLERIDHNLTRLQHLRRGTTEQY